MSSQKEIPVGQSDPKAKGNAEEHEVSDSQLKISHLMDAYKYSLKHVRMSADAIRGGGGQLGLKTATPVAGVVKVIEVEKCSLADGQGIEAGSYLLCANGRQCTGDASQDFKSIDEQGLRMTLVGKRKTALKPDVPRAFLGRHQPQDGCDYKLVRLNTIVCKMSAMNLVKGKGERVCLGLASDRTSLTAFGLRVGDVIVAVDYVQVRDLAHCESLLRSGQNDIVDLTIERPQQVAVPVINVKEGADVSELSLSGDDNNEGEGLAPIGLVPINDYDNDDSPGLGLQEDLGGDPTQGVPKDIPLDVARMLKTRAQDLAKRIITMKSPKAKGMVGVKLAAARIEEPAPLFLTSQEPRLVKINKDVDSTKLKRAASPVSPKKK